MSRFSKDSLLAAIASVLVVAAVIRGLFMIGPLDEQRKRKFDEKRIADLQQASTSINYYYSTHHELPEHLTALAGEPGLKIQLIDPETSDPYSYKKLSADTYELCAKFSMESDDRMDFRWSHKAGKTCYRLTVRH
jgi:hypothetical protein